MTMNRRIFLFGALSTTAALICPPVRKIFVMPSFKPPKFKHTGDWVFPNCCGVHDFAPYLERVTISSKCPTKYVYFTPDAHIEVSTLQRDLSAYLDELHSGGWIDVKGSTGS